jgi:divalent metal cation (Fe/Co/Zn/Cd) transporter
VTHEVVVASLKTLTLVLGGTITFYALRAYRRTGSPALRALSIGFGAITVGAIVAGIADQLLPLDPSLALVIESVFTTLGFGVILYSLFAE